MVTDIASMYRNICVLLYHQIWQFLTNSVDLMTLTGSSIHIHAVLVFMIALLGVVDIGVAVHLSSVAYQHKNSQI